RARHRNHARLHDGGLHRLAPLLAGGCPPHGRHPGAAARRLRGVRQMTARRVLLLLAAYLAVAVVATWPLAPQAADHVVGDEAAQGMCVGTPNLNVWAMGAVLHQLAHDPLHLFDANAFYPYSRSLAFSEHLFVPALLAAPVLFA